MTDAPAQYPLNLPWTLHPITLEQRRQRAALADADEGSQQAAILARHRQEWSDHLDLWWDAHYGRNLELAKLAKLQAETLRLRQIDERQAWGLDKPATAPGQFSFEENLARIRELLQELNLGFAR